MLSWHKTHDIPHAAKWNFHQHITDSAGVALENWKYLHMQNTSGIRIFQIDASIVGCPPWAHETTRPRVQEMIRVCKRKFQVPNSEHL